MGGTERGRSDPMGRMFPVPRGVTAAGRGVVRKGEGPLWRLGQLRLWAPQVHVGPGVCVLIVSCPPLAIGISGKSQILFALVFTTRYLDLFTNFISVYNTVMKVRGMGGRGEGAPRSVRQRTGGLRPWGQAHRVGVLALLLAAAGPGLGQGRGPLCTCFLLCEMQILAPQRVVL